MSIQEIFFTLKYYILTVSSYYFPGWLDVFFVILNSTQRTLKIKLSLWLFLGICRVVKIQLLGELTTQPGICSYQLFTKEAKGVWAK